MPFRSEQISRMLRPARVALFGASARRFAAGNEVLANLREESFGGEILPVHPSAASIDGLEARHGIEELPRDLDVAVVCLPAPSVVDVLRGLEEHGCNAAVVPTSGFDAGAAAAFREFAAASRMAVHGPNNMGIINLSDRVPLWIQHRGVSRLRAGNVGLVAQSGSAAIFVPRSSRDGLYSKIVSSGSEWQLTSADYVEWLASDADTDAIGLVLESIADPDRFAEAVAAARSAGKPLAVLKVGRTAEGQRATTAHTGALAAPDDSYRALFDELDIPVADDYDELAGILEVLSRPRRSARGNRISATTISGGQSALIADLSGRFGVALAPLEDGTRQRLEELIPGGTPSVPVDVGGGSGAHAPYTEILQALADDDTVDTVVVVADAQQTLSLCELEIESDSWDAVNAVYPRTDKPIVVASSSAVSISQAFASEVTAPVAIVRGFGPALAAVRALAANRRPVTVPRAGAHEVVLDDETRTALREEIARHEGALPAPLVRRVLAAYGIAYAEGVVVRSAGEAPAAAASLRAPLVAKVLSAAIPHRTEAGCVITGIEDDHALTSAVAEILDRAGSIADAVEGVEIQEQLDTRLEAVVGFTSTIHGPYLVVGSGGVLVELLGDTAGGLTPMTVDHAAALIRSTALGTRMAGYRGIVPATTHEPLARLVRRVSLLARDLGDLLGEADLNPVLVQPGTGEALVVDALLVRTTSEIPH